MTERPTLLDIDDDACTKQAEIDRIKQEFGITHHNFDCWIYGFLKNKKYDLAETISKLKRRFAMEVNELATYEITDEMESSFRKGIIQEIGFDKLGRSILYVFTKRDFPNKSLWDMRLQSFDIMVSYATRLRKDNKRCQLILIVNQKGASLLKNIDLRFQSKIALRISKYYPGMIDKVYVCNMGSILSACSKPIIAAFPASVSEIIEILSDSDIKNGALTQIVDQDVLPVELGGRNYCDNPVYWDNFTDKLLHYYRGIKTGVNEFHLSIKEWELKELGIDFTPMQRKQPNHNLAAFNVLGGGSGCGTGDTSSLKTPSFDRSSRISSSAYLPIDCDDNTEYDNMQRTNSWHRMMSHFELSEALFILEELFYWRNEVEAQEMRDWLNITNLAKESLTEIIKKKAFAHVLKNSIKSGAMSKGSVASEASSKKRKKPTCRCVVC